MRYLGIDYGAKRIGLSLSDAGGQFAFPHETIPTDTTSVDRIRAIMEREKVGGLVMGDTKAVHGADNPITAQAEKFADALSAHTGKEVIRSWEAWSSVEAARFEVPGGVHNDASAAAIILQRYLDAHPVRA